MVKINSLNIQVATNLFKYKKIVPEQDISDLIQNVKSKSVFELVISSPMDEVMSIDKPGGPIFSYMRKELKDKDGETIISESVNKEISIPLDNVHYTKVNKVFFNKLMDASLENNVKTTFIEKSFNDNPVVNSINIAYEYIFPVFLLILILRMFSTFFSMANSFGKPSTSTTSMTLSDKKSTSLFNPFNFGKESEIKERMKRENISLASWIGSPEVFEECTEVISFLKNETSYRKMGAQLPTGILLAGPPGTGKTLLAKAIASETNAHFISVAASQFVEMFVGMGAARVRDLWKEARLNRPSIIFIDEIDSIGKKRGSGPFSGGDEREQTLNQILTEMDGFNDNKEILIIAATNMLSSLDPALTRPGRFDRIIQVPLPDTESRIAMLKFYFQNKKLDPLIDISSIAKSIGGFSGADIANLVNEAAIFAVRRCSDIISEIDLFNALEKLTIGIIKKNDTRTYESKMRIAIHELGHAFMVSSFRDDFSLTKISIASTYSGAGGYTLYEENSNFDGLYTKIF